MNPKPDSSMAEAKADLAGILTGKLPPRPDGPATEPVDLSAVAPQDYPDYEFFPVLIPHDILIRTAEDIPAAEEEIERRFQVEARSDFYVYVYPDGFGFSARLLRE